MSLFIFIFFAIYAFLHGYVLWKVQRAFPDAGGWLVVLGAFFVLMMIGPIAVQLVQSSGHVRLGHALGLVWYSWMAVIWWLFVLTLASDTWNLAARSLASFWPAAHGVILSDRWALLGSVALVVIAAVVSVREAQEIRLTTVEVSTRRLPPGSAPIRIVQLSDLHLGINTGLRRLERAAQLVRDARPDLLVSTGDLSDSRVEYFPELAAVLHDLEAPLGKLAITGNHEFYLGIEDATAFHQAAGFRLLRGEAVTVGPGLCVAGVDDPAGQGLHVPCFLDERAVLPQAGSGRLTVLLKHRPVVDSASVGRFDVQLSGHTHGGQIFPFHIFTYLTFKFVTGLHALPGGESWIYVSRGLGTWGPPMRLGAPPEVTLIILKPAEGP
jgi:hypothetical protein